MQNPITTDVLIIGGGWAGLSAAIKLTDNGKSVCLLEAGKELGGRARKVQYKNLSIDNGTHIMIGAYNETLKLISKVHAHSKYKISDLLERQSLNLHYKHLNDGIISIFSAPLTAPFNILIGFLFAKGLSLKEKLLILKVGLKIKLNLIKLAGDTDLLSFLKLHQQTNNIITCIWEPLCLAIMNTSIEKTSTEIFLSVLKDAFFSSRTASDLLLFKKNLTETFPNPAKNYIEQRNGKVLLNHRVNSIKQEGAFYSAHSKEKVYQAKTVIIATAPNASIKLLQSLNNISGIDSVINHLSQLTFQPICTVYLQFPSTIKVERSMQGFLGTTSQWLFDKSSINQAGFVSVIISSDGEHTGWENSQLIDKVSHELTQLYPDWPQPIDAFVIREKRATFTASVNINRIRPSNRTDMTGIWLAGDFTNTHYPATLEGAVRSGLQCAETILLEQ